MFEEQQISDSEITYFRKSVISMGKKLYHPYLWRNTKNNFHSLTVEVMLQRTRAEQVENVYESFIQKYNKPSDFVRDSNATVFDNLGLSWREKTYRELCKILSEADNIPSDRKDLKKLPGVGDYVASAYRSLHLNLSDVLIDSNIVRLYGRYFGFTTNNETRRKKWFQDLAKKITPQKKNKEFNYALLDFTRFICKTKPDCEKCLLKTRCKINT